MEQIAFFLQGFRSHAMAKGFGIFDPDQRHERTYFGLNISGMWRRSGRAAEISLVG